MQNQSFKMTVGDEMFLIWQMFIKKNAPQKKSVLEICQNMDPNYTRANRTNICLFYFENGWKSSVDYQRMMHRTEIHVFYNGKLLQASGPRIPGFISPGGYCGYHM